MPYFNMNASFATYAFMNWMITANLMSAHIPRYSKWDVSGRFRVCHRTCRLRLDNNIFKKIHDMFHPSDKEEKK